MRRARYVAAGAAVVGVAAYAIPGMRRAFNAALERRRAMTRREDSTPIMQADKQYSGENCGDPYQSSLLQSLQSG